MVIHSRIPSYLHAYLAYLFFTISFFHVDDQKRFHRTILTRVVALEGMVEENSRKLSAISIQRGVSIQTPFKLPLSTSEDFETASSWLVDEENFNNFVSFLLRFVIYLSADRLPCSGKVQLKTLSTQICYH